MRIGIRELRQHASRYLARVKAGETVEVTDRGVLVALLVPPVPGRSAREQLIVSGRLEPAVRPFQLPSRRRSSSGSEGAHACPRRPDVIYLDTSALLKLVVQEGESDDLAAWLDQRTVVPRITSALTRVELVRACRRLDSDLVPAATELLARVDTIPLREEVLESAAALPDPALRSLNALHLASAVLMGN